MSQINEIFKLLIKDTCLTTAALLILVILSQSELILESNMPIVNNMIKENISEIFLQQLLHLSSPVIVFIMPLIVICILFVPCRIINIVYEKLTDQNI